MGPGLLYYLIRHEWQQPFWERHGAGKSMTALAFKPPIFIESHPPSAMGVRNLFADIWGGQDDYKPCIQAAYLHQVASTVSSHLEKTDANVRRRKGDMPTLNH